MRKTGFGPRIGELDGKIGKGFLVIGSLIAIGKFAGAIKEIAIAWRYGVGATVDAFAFVMSIITWPVAVWFSVLTVVLVPMIARQRVEQPALLRDFQAELFGATLLVGLLVGLVVSGSLYSAINAGWSGLSPGASAQARALSLMLAPIIPLGLLIGLFSAWTMGVGSHRNTLLEAVPAIAVALCLALPVDWMSSPLVIGVLLGYAAQTTLLLLTLISRNGVAFPRLRFDSPVWRSFSGGVGLLAFGQLAASVSSVIDHFLAAHLATGDLSALSYANRIASLLLSIGAIGISRVTMPIFAEAHAANSGSARSTAIKWAALMFAAGLIIGALVWVCSEDIVQLVLERGAFREDDTAAVSRVLGWSMLQVPFYFGGLVMMSMLAAEGRVMVIALSGFLNVFVRTSIAYILLDKYGLSALMIAAAATYAISFGLFISVVSGLPPRFSVGSK